MVAVAAVPEVGVAAAAVEAAVVVVVAAAGAGRDKANRIDQSAYGCFKEERFHNV